MGRNFVRDGIFGVCVGDALGVAVEFTPRSILKETPITDMVGNRTPHHQPPGTWSDDSSLTLCLADSLCHGFDLHDIADRICRWYHENYWTPHGSVFDVGGTTRVAILRLKQGVAPTKAGGTGEYENGNGSLMRILPLVYYVNTLHDVGTRFEIIHDVSAITHAHPRSKVACSIYIQFALHLLNGALPHDAYQQTQHDICDYYRTHRFKNELVHFTRILNEDISAYPEEKIQSSTYVVHTLEASLWCLLRNTSYHTTVLTAVNLGDDTDTVAAVTGGLAGLYYGYDSIPERWRSQIARKDDILALADRLFARLT